MEEVTSDDQLVASKLQNFLADAQKLVQDDAKARVHAVLFYARERGPGMTVYVGDKTVRFTHLCFLS